ncbi:MAG: hypothetical protein HYX27_28180 [Acidobacteria bacterium]|nr:hypothetical protein [Acidobacteriota bacterium]
MKIISVGEILWDLYPGSEHLGGAPFNFAAHARRLEHEVLFLSAVGNDSRGNRAIARLADLGLSCQFVPRIAGQPTGFVSVDLQDGNQPRYVIHRPAAYDFVQLSDTGLDEIAEWRPDWIYYGTLHQMDMRGKEATERLIGRCPDARRFYDINLRASSFTPELVTRLVDTADVVKLNEAEVRAVAQILGAPFYSLEQFCREYAEWFDWEAVCVTRGANGCALLVKGEYVEAAGYSVHVRDAVGAGDAFAAAFLHGLASDWRPRQIADFANRLGALVASRDGAVPPWEPEECRALVRHSAT